MFTFKFILFSKFNSKIKVYGGSQGKFALAPVTNKPININAFKLLVKQDFLAVQY